MSCRSHDACAALERLISARNGDCLPLSSVGGVVASVEAGYLVVVDLGAVRGGLDEHAEVDGQGGPVGEGEVDAEVAEDQVVGGAAGFQDAVGGGHAERLGRVVVGDARITRCTTRPTTGASSQTARPAVTNPRISV